MCDPEDLLRAVYRQDRFALLRQLAAGADINGEDGDGRTPLMHAVLASDADASWIELLLELGANPNVADSGQGWTALHFAVRDQKVDVARALLKAGAPVDAPDKLGNTPLWRATAARIPNERLIQVLIELGAIPDASNREGVSPRMVAARLGHASLF